jgi:hypothetical protein
MAKKTEVALKENAKLTKVLNEKLQAKYKVVGLPKTVSSQINFPKYGSINFKKLTLKGAQALLKKGFPYLVAK